MSVVMSQLALLLIVFVWLIAITVLAITFWRCVKQLERRLHQMSGMTQRHDRDIAQQRYALAMMRQMQQENTEIAHTDQDLLDSAVEQLEQADQQQTQAEVQMLAAPNAVVGGLSDKEILQFVKKAIQNNQLAFSRQPIVTLPKRKVKYYEIFSRILMGDQGYIPAHKFISIAKNNNLMSVMDNLLLLRCLQSIKQNAQSEQSAGFFVNISSQTLGSKSYITDLIEFLQLNPKLSSRLVFELTQADTMNIAPATKSVMEGLALLGCRFSMDQVTMFGMDTDRLRDLNISFVKLDTRALEKEMDNPPARGRMKRIKTGLEAQGIQVIAEKLENEKQLLNIIDLYIDHGQGYLFGQPELMA